jgi:hypothetical protein
MTTSGPGPTASPRLRALVVALLAVLAFGTVAPVIEAAHAHDDDRCCRNGICCCRPKDQAPGPCLRGVCRCAGHDGDPSGSPLVRQLLPPMVYRLPKATESRALVLPGTPALDNGFVAPPFHPPRPSVV